MIGTRQSPVKIITNDSMQLANPADVQHRLADSEPLEKMLGVWGGQMKPITFNCHENLPLAPEKVAQQILDLAKWPDFRGYGPIPGIKSAEFETRTPNVVGSRIRVTNLDGSTHVEEIVEWQSSRRLQLRMVEFSKPLSGLATGFVETWEFERVGHDTRALRSFELNAKSMLTKPVLWFISFFLKQAIARHLSEIQQAAKES